MIESGGNGVRVDLRVIGELVKAGSRVLDVGCGDGALLDYLRRFKRVDARGIELGMEGVRAAVAQGLPVIQGDADVDLKDYPADAFDYAILSKTLQATRDPRGVLQNLLRIGRRAIVSFPNFGYWRNRLQFALGGKMPVNDTLPYQWYETPNIHFCTVRDFVALCDALGYEIEQMILLDRAGRIRNASARFWAANLWAIDAVCVLRRGKRSGFDHGGTETGDVRASARRG